MGRSLARNKRELTSKKLTTETSSALGQEAHRLPEPFTAPFKQAKLRSITQPHYPQMPFSVSECLPLRSPFLIRLYDILIRVVRQVTRQSSDGGNRPQSRADGTLEGVPAPLRQPTRPSGARVHRAGAPAPALDGSSGRDSRGGLRACELALLATIHWARVRHAGEPVGGVLSPPTGVATA